MAHRGHEVDKVLFLTSTPKKPIGMRTSSFARSQSGDGKRNLPPVTPFTLFEASRVGYRDVAPAEIVRRPYWMPRRIRNPHYLKDQSLLPAPKPENTRVSDSAQTGQFAIREFHLSTTTEIVPEFDVIPPIQARATLTTDGVRQVIQYRPPKLIELFRQVERDNEGGSNGPLLDQTSTVVTLHTPKKEPDLKGAVAFLLKSAVAPAQFVEDHEIALQSQSMKRADLAQAPVQALPSVLNINVFDGECAKTEMAALTGREKRSKDDGVRKMRVEMGVQRNDEKRRFLNDSKELDLGAGEFVVIECVDKSPIIRPLIGMASQMDVLVDDVEADEHPFDPRLPLTRVTANGLQPFISPIPQNKFVIMLQSSVCVSACYPHVSNKTDFILTCGPRPRLFRLPKVTYVATSPEIRVVLPTPESRNSEMQGFWDWQDQPVEELCKRRAIIEGLDELAKHVPNTKRKTPVQAAVFKQVKSPEMRMLLHKYNTHLRNTPWFRSKMAIRAKIGIVAGLAETMDEECDKRKTQRDYKLEARRRFEARLAFIESSAQPETDIDFDDMDLDFEEEESEFDVDWNGIDEKQNGTDFIPMNQRQSMVRTRINWNALGFGHLPKRKLIKEVTYTIEDGEAKAEVRWIRDQAEIARRRRNVRHPSPHL